MVGKKQKDWAEFTRKKEKRKDNGKKKDDTDRNSEET